MPLNQEINAEVIQRNVDKTPVFSENIFSKYEDVKRLEVQYLRGLKNLSGYLYSNEKLLTGNAV